MTILCKQASGRKTPDLIIVPAVCATNKTAGKPIPAAWTRIVSGEELTSPEHVYEASRRLVAAGLSVIPIEAYEGSKAPDSRRLPHPHDPVTGQGHRITFITVKF